MLLIKSSTMDLLEKCVLSDGNNFITIISPMIPIII